MLLSYKLAEFMATATPSAPFNDIIDLIGRMPDADQAAADQVRARDAQLTKPAGSLGRLEELAVWLASWQANYPPRAARPMVAIFAANHGVVARGVSAFPQEVTHQMVANFQAGGAAINQLCRSVGAGLKVFELALEIPTKDIVVEDAMDAAGCAGTIAYGMEAVAEGGDMLAIGEMGIGNTTIAAALAHGLFGGAASDWAGRGTGVDDAGLARKQEAVAAAVARLHAEHGKRPHPLTVLAALGGRDVAAMVGAILAARFQRIPVVVDGFVASAAAAVLHAITPAALDHCVFGHTSAEGAHARMLQLMGKRALLDLGMRLGEGSGAALAIGIIKAAIETHNGMHTFADAGVSNADG